MSRRSVTNDRYRVEQKGKTRKSASSAKPKREAGVATSSGTTSAKKKPQKRSFWNRGSASAASARVEQTPEMKRLRKWWWALMGVAIVIALAMIPVSKMNIKTLDSVLFGLYAVALGGALYLEFGPLRKLRQAAVASAKEKPGAKKAAKGDSKKGDSRE